MKNDVLKIFDSQDYITKEEEVLLQKISYIKKNITNFLSHKDMVMKIIEIIEHSHHFYFKNERNRKYINIHKPVFVISIDSELLNKENGNSLKTIGVKNPDSIKRQNDEKLIDHLIRKEIVSPYSDYLRDFITNNELFKEILKSNGIDEISSIDYSVISFMTSAIFTINVSTEENIIYLEYFI